jgi:Sec7-like guanine-nucleotide exchange factor
MKKAALKFNLKPKNGIAYLVQAKLIAPVDDFNQHVRDIVSFLKTTPALDKTEIGVFLGADVELNKACLYEFIDQFDLKGVAYVQSLKTILQGFRLPGEGQIVDRVMEKFGEKFIADNPTGSDGVQGVMSAECVYLLSYATMMMQTSLHNPNAAKSRMSLEDFKKMIKGINSG